MADFNSSLPVRTQTAGDVIIKVADATTPSQQLAINASGEASVTATNLDIRDLTSASDSVEVLQSTHDDLNGNFTIQVSDTDAAVGNPVPVRLSDGSAYYTAMNPLPVSSTEAVANVVDYNTSSAVASSASVNHDYTVTALMTLMVKNIFVAGSGKIKAEVKIETSAGSGTFNTVFVKFNSTASPDVDFTFGNAITVGAGVILRITITNREASAQDVYSTVVGFESA